MGMVKVFSWATGRIVLMDETLANGYFRLNGAYVVGSPVNDAAALRRPFWAPTPVAPINWQSMPKIASGGGDYMLAPGNYLNDDPTKPLLDVNGLNRRVVIAGLPGQPMRLRSRGDLFAGYGLRLLLQNTLVEAANPGVYGQTAGKLLRCDDNQMVEVFNNFIDGTSGCSLGTGGSGKWQGNGANGDHMRIQRNIVRNIRGQCSDGTYDAANPMVIVPVRSNWGSNHSDDQRWKPGAARTDANRKDPNLFGPLGWISSQFVQFRGQAGMVDSAVTDNYILHQWGQDRCEDNLAAFTGSGGTASSHLVFARNFVYGGQGLDWNWRPGQGMVYDGSNRITLNAVGYQDVSQTEYSGSGGGITDGAQASTATGSYALNTAYIDVLDQVVLGNTITHQAGHDTHWLRNQVHQLVVTDDGSPLGYDHAFFQVTDYAPGITAVDGSGTARPLWAVNEFDGNTLRSGTASGSSPLIDAPSITTARKNGGSYSDSTNLRLPRLADGFETSLYQSWLSGQSSAGRTIGLTG